MGKAFRAYGLRVLVNVQEMTRTKGGLHLPEDARVSNFATGVMYPGETSQPH
jgi:hypothetical protein